MVQLGGKANLVICQKSKTNDWISHMAEHYFADYSICDLTNAEDLSAFCERTEMRRIGVINYDLVFRRQDLLKVQYDTVMLDESSLIQNPTAKRTKAIMRLKTKNIILLSGTPTGGKYERLYSQLKLLGLDMTKKEYWDTFVVTRDLDMGGFKLPIVTGYKNVGRLKRMMRRLGCHFLKTDEVFDLPNQSFTNVFCPPSRQYKHFRKTGVVRVEDKDLVGETTLTQMLYERMLCGAYSSDKLKTLRDLIDSTDDRLIIFYNFNDELIKLKEVCKGAKRRTSIVNGQVKDLTAYETVDDSVTLIQYQAGALGLNLQKANKTIYFSPPLSSELYEQSKKRTHRIGQDRACFYWKLIVQGSIEEKIYAVLNQRQDYTEKLFQKGGV